MLYRTLKRVIENAKSRGLPTGDVEKKLDIFFAAGKLSEDEYRELVGMLHPEHA